MVDVGVWERRLNRRSLPPDVGELTGLFISPTCIIPHPFLDKSLATIMDHSNINYSKTMATIMDHSIITYSEFLTTIMDHSIITYSESLTTIMDHSNIT